MYSIFWNLLGEPISSDNYAGGNMTRSAALMQAWALARRNPDRVYSIRDEDVDWLRHTISARDGQKNF